MAGKMSARRNGYRKSLSYLDSSGNSQGLPKASGSGSRSGSGSNFDQDVESEDRTKNGDNSEEISYQKNELRGDGEDDEEVSFRGLEDLRKSKMFNTPMSTRGRDIVRRKLKYFFMNPIDKWRAKGRLPWKLGLQVLKIVLVTAQLMLFGTSMSLYMEKQENMMTSFRELFLTDWDPVREVESYPPEAGAYAVYTKRDLFDHINHVVTVYSTITTDPIGNYGYSDNITEHNPMSPIIFCNEFYSTGVAYPTKFFYNYTNTVMKRCVQIYNESLLPGDPIWQDFDIVDYLEAKNITIAFSRLLSITLTLPLRTIYLNSLDLSDEPECYEVNVSITYDNTQHDGQTIISLDSHNQRHDCDGNLNYISPGRRKHRFDPKLLSLNIFVIFLCLTSFILCLRSLIRGWHLRKEITVFFKSNFGRELTMEDQMKFLDLWIIMILINDSMIMMGSILKIRLEKKLVDQDLYDACALLLGM